ncbi:hypothetical protein P154DRAFT_518623 [Amniculicola lignicola CBS 123094]|uniref:Uncharacterized protein n=1 Tax=Amniculicola lignicola CBS 123094 TaxID=1392246 RepID=A0A6A5WV95_9PLEO|nr:hypothetical protein P154DRAFT_518623 [Amniculicola lignicola CBS 123094]
MRAPIHLPLRLLIIICCATCLVSAWWPFHRATPKPPRIKRIPTARRISHQAASDPNQDILPYNVAWFGPSGVPLFYSAWRARAGFPSPEPTARSTILRHGARIACWPSTGGVWIKTADVAEIDFLDIDRFEDTPRQFNTTAEDEFCQKLRMTGAEWWQLPPDFGSRDDLGDQKYACRTVETCFEPQIKNKYLLGWPECSYSACYVEVEKALLKGGETLMGLANAQTMDERCTTIWRLGGSRCRCRAQCSDLNFLDWGDRDSELACIDAPFVMRLQKPGEGEPIRGRKLPCPKLVQ